MTLFAIAFSLLAPAHAQATPGQSADIDVSGMTGTPTNLTALDASSAQGISNITVPGGLQPGAQAVDNGGNVWTMSRDGRTLGFDSGDCNDLVLKVTATQNGAQSDVLRVASPGCGTPDEWQDTDTFAGYILASFSGCGTLLDAAPYLALVAEAAGRNATIIQRSAYTRGDQWTVNLQIDDHAEPTTFITDALEWELGSYTVESRRITGTFRCETSEWHTATIEKGTKDATIDLASDR
jgi:hypothetical protein